MHRNSPLILTFIVKNWTLLIQNISYLHNTQALHQLTRFFFNTGFYKLYKTFLTKWNPVLMTNYTKSLQYWTLKLNIGLLNKSVEKTHLALLDDQFIYNQYFTNVVMSNISLHSKYYRTVLLKFISLLTLNWQLWSRNYNISFKFLLISKNFHLIRFYNTYFFKMYNF